MPNSVFESGEGADSPMGRLVKTACALFSAPVGLCSIFVHDRMVRRTLVGLPDFMPAGPVPFSPTRLLIAEGPGALLQIQDALTDPRVRDLDLVRGPSGLRSYVGATVADGEGRAVGSIGVMDTKPRPPLTPDEIEHLRRFAVMAGDLFELERTFSAKREALELAATRAKSDFLANTSHEIRTPLTSIIGFSAFLKSSPTLTDRERHYATRISAASTALLGVIDAVLDYSKLETDAFELDPATFDPRRTAEEATAMIAESCREKGLTLDVEVDAVAPVVMVADEARVRQVMLNLLSNAVKFTETGGVALRLGRIGRRLRVEVADTGIGISPEAVERLFDRFTQADSSTTKLYGGAGLGLAISRRLVIMMGGEIGVASTPGEGSTFWFEIPLEPATPDDPPRGALF